MLRRCKRLWRAQRLHLARHRWRLPGSLGSRLGVAASGPAPRGQSEHFGLGAIEHVLDPRGVSDDIIVPIFDMIIHTWDLAKATGQNTTLDSGLCEIGYNVVSGIAPTGREMGAFGPEVVVPDTASFQDRMLGMSGRTP